ncbi:unnamed protein product [Gongylonema pulchrum]|uniref:CBM20 domain-containing protein n=1 Tax=Gongylonema pulchrum TaxID=637853 RepID=A0A183CWS2_9BILA|nr:unnamed protein product [Gongylonema pulchrum]
MVFAQDRPIPAPRTSLIERKPPVPKRVLRPVVAPRRRDRGGNAQKEFPANVSDNHHVKPQSISQNHLIRNPLRRTKSAPETTGDVRKMAPTKIHRLHSFHFSPVIVEGHQFRGDFTDKTNAEQDGTSGRGSKRQEAILECTAGRQGSSDECNGEHSGFSSSRFLKEIPGSPKQGFGVSTECAKKNFENLGNSERIISGITEQDQYSSIIKSGKKYPNEISGSVERGRVARIAEMLDSAMHLHENAANPSPVTSINAANEPTATAPSNSVASGTDCADPPVVTQQSPDAPNDCTDPDDVFLLSDFNSNTQTVGIWNPGYVGLEEYRRLAELSGDTASTSATCTKGFDFWNKNHWSRNTVDSLEAIPEADDGRGRTKSDGSVSPEEVYLSGWAQVHLNKKDRGRLWVIVEKDALACWANEDEDGNAEIGPYFFKNLIYVGKFPMNNTMELHIRETVGCNHWTSVKLSLESAVLDYWVLSIAKVSTSGFRGSTDLNSYLKYKFIFEASI